VKVSSKVEGRTAKVFTTCFRKDFKSSFMTYKGEILVLVMNIRGFVLLNVVFEIDGRDFKVIKCKQLKSLT